ncbi:ParB N-terminal domain-containing protein [Rhodococcus tibetensis]|uniref:ParB N-terminal domain-containing protein n=1 Tax=Rhodococcus tibetensis TaxID=2965064 RepID=UPI0027E36AC6|nr:ParB N-terminal domain-containing protein [Rhodococcus sp. FXJ9.536]
MGEANGKGLKIIHVLLNQKGGVGKSTVAVNLAAVTADVLNQDDDRDATSPVAAVSVGPTLSHVPLSELAPDPRNPRDDLGDLRDLVSITGTQLQRALVVTRSAYLRLYPEDETEIGRARWIVINGCRRLAAAENVGRRDFDVIEEAKAVELMVVECGTVGRQPSSSTNPRDGFRNGGPRSNWHRTPNGHSHR